MGLELSGRVKHATSNGETQRGVAKILLETDDLILRGEVRATIPRASIRTAVARGGTVELTHGGGRLTLTLGAAAANFVEKVIEPPKSRLSKMGIAEGSAIVLLNLRDKDFESELAALNVRASRRARRDSSIIVLGVEASDELARIPLAAKSLAPTGSLWVVHPKGVNGVKDTDIFAEARKAGLTYTKVARYSATHTAEKLVIPRSSRSQVNSSRSALAT